MRPAILVLDKAPGERSTGCVAIARRALGGGKVGHAGTLDSPASGVLLLLLGAATRLASYAMALPKEYLVTLRFGVVTSTDDASGAVLASVPLPHPEELRRRVARALPAFLGRRMQVPPQISAVHVDGERAHELARRGEEFEISPKPVTILCLREIAPVDAEGRMTLRVFCGKGTYVRSLVRDLGNRVGCGAFVESLRRLRVGDFAAENGTNTERIRAEGGRFVEASSFPVTKLVRHFPTYSASAGSARDIANGRAVPLGSLERRTWGVLSPREGLFVISGDTVAEGTVILGTTPLFQPRVVLRCGEERA